ncbi:MAG: DUF1641 domain-containing protein [Myxococcales bacterium]|jgi:hypothetical protein
MDASEQARLMESMERLEARVARIESAVAQLAELMGEAPGVVSTAVDTFDHYAARALEHGVDERLKQTFTLLDRIGRALTEALPPDGHTERLGLFGLLRALSDPDVQRTTGMAIRFAQRFGEGLYGSAVGTPRQLRPSTTEGGGQ